jgi:ABC-2 type transport system permease protein
MRDVLTELEAGTLRRQLHAPVGTGTVILAKAGFTAAVSLIALAVLSVTGWLAVEGPVDVAGYVLLSAALVVAVTGAGATVYGAAGSQNRGATISSMVYLALAFAGGSFIPLDSLPGAMRALAPVSPFYWGTRGYQQLLVHGGGAAEILGPAAVLSGLGVVLLAVGAMLLHRRLARGG